MKQSTSRLRNRSLLARCLVVAGLLLGAHEAPAATSFTPLSTRLQGNYAFSSGSYTVDGKEQTLSRKVPEAFKPAITPIGNVTVGSDGLDGFDFESLTTIEGIFSELEYTPGPAKPSAVGGKGTVQGSVEGNLGIYSFVSGTGAYVASVDATGLRLTVSAKATLNTSAPNTKAALAKAPIKTHTVVIRVLFKRVSALLLVIPAPPPPPPPPPPPAP
jgi:hypothetical protein